MVSEIHDGWMTIPKSGYVLYPTFDRGTYGQGLRGGAAFDNVFLGMWIDPPCFPESHPRIGQFTELDGHFYRSPLHFHGKNQPLFPVDVPYQSIDPRSPASTLGRWVELPRRERFAGL